MSIFGRQGLWCWCPWSWNFLNVSHQAEYWPIRTNITLHIYCIGHHVLEKNVIIVLTMRFWHGGLYHVLLWTSTKWILWSFPVAFPGGVSTWVYAIHILAIKQGIKVIFWGGLCYVKNRPWISWLLTFRVLDCLMYMCFVDSRSIFILTILKKMYLSQRLAKKEDQRSQVTNGRKAGKKTWEQIISHRIHARCIYQNFKIN